MAVVVEKVITPRQKRDFIKFPHALYKNDKNWVSPLLMDDYRKINRKKNPFYQHAEAEFFLARRDGAIAGRIAAVHDSIWEQTHKEKAAYWGWFECVDDPAVAKALFDTAFDWARKRGCVRIIGPMSPNANDLIGCQVEGFDGSPVLLMTYNPPYYDRLISENGNRKWKDLLAWLLEAADAPDRLAEIMPRVEAKGGFTLRNVNMKDFPGEIKRFNELYNQFEQVNAVFTPMTPAELQLMAKDLKIAVDPDFIFFAEVDGKPVGVSLSLPDFNVAFKAARGRLFPLGIFHLLTARKRIKFLRTISMGVLKDYRNRGIDLALYYHTFLNGKRKGYRGGEMSWVEEDNVNMTNTALKLGGKPYRKYRVYEHVL
ncbi:MAG TPA: GNAT family N-acetyltransferase [Spirochaetia bacterium]|nr:GNAT family N-acetyltransferase [Spirochaetia bacterium]